MTCDKLVGLLLMEVRFESCRVDIKNIDVMSKCRFHNCTGNVGGFELGKEQVLPNGCVDEGLIDWL